MSSVRSCEALLDLELAEKPTQAAGHESAPPPLTAQNENTVQGRSEGKSSQRRSGVGSSSLLLHKLLSSGQICCFTMFSWAALRSRDASQTPTPISYLLICPGLGGYSPVIHRHGDRLPGTGLKHAHSTALHQPHQRELGSVSAQRGREDKRWISRGRINIRWRENVDVSCKPDLTQSSSRRRKRINERSETLYSPGEPSFILSYLCCCHIVQLAQIWDY